MLFICKGKKTKYTHISPYRSFVCPMLNSAQTALSAVLGHRQDSCNIYILREWDGRGGVYHYRGEGT